MSGALDLYNLRLSALEHLLSLPPESQPSVTILGAGISGLSAGSILRHFTRRVHILEARDRIGGRIHTTGDMFDLGAAWIHGLGPGTMCGDPRWRKQINPLYKIVKQHGIVTVPTWKEGERGCLEKTFMADGGKVPKKVNRYRNQIEEWVEGGACEKAKVGESFGDLVMKRYKGRDRQILEFVMKILYCEGQGADPYQVSAKYIN